MTTTSKTAKTAAHNAAARKWQALSPAERASIQKVHAIDRSDNRAAAGMRPLFEDAWALSMEWLAVNRSKWSN